jgi:hypothetical protein
MGQLTLFLRPFEEAGDVPKSLGRLLIRGKGNYSVNPSPTGQLQFISQETAV